MPEETPTGLSAEDWRRILEVQPLQFAVLSNSMWPAFAQGESVRIRPLGPGEPKRGQILAFFRQMLVTHRYLGNGCCLGDNAPSRDEMVQPEDMVGIVDAVLRDGREIPLGCASPWGLRAIRMRFWLRKLKYYAGRVVRFLLGCARRK